MADLALAIVGVCGTGAALIVQLRKLGQSIEGATEDANSIATNLELQQAVLHNLKELLESNPDIHSSGAVETLKGLLRGCKDIHTKVDISIAPLLPSSNRTSRGSNLKNKIKWHFKQQDVRLLLAQLEQIKSTLQVMISTLVLGRVLQLEQRDTTSPSEVTPRLRRTLRSARESVICHQQGLESLALEEQQAASSSEPPVQATLAQYPGVASSLGNIVLSKTSDINSDEDHSSTPSSSILSAQQRVITGAQSDTIEYLLERWTTLSQGNSETTKSKVESALSNLESHDGECQNGILQCTDRMSVSSSGSEDTQTPPASHRVVGNLESPPPEECDRKVTKIPKASGTFNQALPSEGRSPEADTENLVATIALTRADNDSHTNSPYMLGSIVRTSSFDRGPLTFTEAWLQLCEPDGVEFEDEDEINIAFWGVRGPFSDITILENTSSRAPSVVSNISSIQGPNDPHLAQKFLYLGKQLMKARSFPGALDMFQKAYRAKDCLDDKEICQLEFDFGVIYAEMQDFTLSEKILRRALRTQNEFAMDIKMVRATQHFLARTLARQKKWQRASQMYHHLWMGRRATLNKAESGASSIELALRTGQEYCRVLVELQKADEAILILESLLPKAMDFHCLDDHKIILNIKLDMGRAYNQQRRRQDAKSILKDLLGKLRPKPGIQRIKAISSYELATIAYQEQKYQESLDFASEAFRLFDLLGQSDKPEHIYSVRCIAMAEIKLGKFQDALSALETLRSELICFESPNPYLIIQIDADRAEILLLLKQDATAKMVLLEAFDIMKLQLPVAQRKYEDIALKVLEQLGPLILRMASNESTRSQVEQELKLAQPVYERLYAQHKFMHGNSALLSLQTGHTYGSLCFSIKEFSLAEAVLKEVWSSKKIALGTDSPSTLQSGLQLSQVLYANDKCDEAFATLKSVFDLAQALTDRGSLEVIERSELMAFWCMSRKVSSTVSHDAFEFMKAAFRARHILFGPTKDTCNAAVKVANIAMAKREFQQSRQMFDYVFQEAIPAGLANAPRGSAIISCGLSSSALSYLSDCDAGNNQMERVIVRAEKLYGGMSSPARSLKHMYASMLFSQGHRRRSIRVLRDLYHQENQLDRLNHPHQDSTGILLGLALITESLLMRKPISVEVDAIDEKMGQRLDSTTILVHLTLAMATFLAMFHFKDPSHQLFKWAYKRQKQRFGRFSREAAVVLAVVYSHNGLRVYRKARGTMQNGNVPRTLEKFFEQIWIYHTKNIRKQVAELSVRKLAQEFGKDYLWNRFNGEMMKTSPFYRMFFRGERETRDDEKMVREEGPAREALFNTNDLPAFPVITDDGLLSQVWTIESQNDENSNVKDEDIPFDLSEILGSAQHQDISSFAGSLVDLLTSRDEDFEQAESNISRLSSKLVDETISNQEMDDARSNVEFLEKETGIGE